MGELYDYIETEETEEVRRDEHLRQVILPSISCRQRFGVSRAWKVSIPTPFHSISFPPWEEENDLELGIHIYMLFGFFKPCIIVMFELIW